MTAADGVAGAMFLAILVYSIFAGADFGSGVWDLLAGNSTKGASTRRLIDRAIGPVWEANHVWLIFVLVFLWTGFPVAFAALMRSVAIPFWLVGLGIVLRGTGFAFRKFAPSPKLAQAAGVIFAISSILTPFFLGVIAGAVASGRVDPNNSAGGLSVWLSVTSVLGGLLAVLTCTFLAGVFLTEEADRHRLVDLSEKLKDRSVIVGLLTGIVALAGTIPLLADSPTLSEGLMGKASPLVILSAIFGLGTIVLLTNRHYRYARLGAVGAVGSIIAGWGIGQYPWFLVDQISIEDAAANPTTLKALLITCAIAAVLVLPPMVYLFMLSDRSKLQGH